MKKRWLFTAFLTIALCIACFVLIPTEAEAAEISSGTCGENLTWVLDDSGTLTISGSGSMSGVPWEDYKSLIKSVVIEKGVTSISFSAFEDCVGLSSVYIPDSVHTIEWNAFADCDSLSSISIPNGVKKIDSSTFSGCNSLVSIEIPDSVTSIEEYAFAYCNRLTNIIISKNVTSIGDCAFIGCGNLSGNWVDADNPQYSTDVHGALFDKNKTVLIHVPDAFSAHYTVPDSVLVINEDAFFYCENLTSITIPDSVKVIQEGAFYGCTNLSSITLPEGITRIERSTFINCGNLRSITIPRSVTYIDCYAFSHCNRLWHVFYMGSEAEWNAITIKLSAVGSGNHFVNIARHYNCTGEEEIDPVNEVCSICRGNCTHTWDSGKVTTEATCSQAGVKTYTCAECKETKTEEIAKLTSHTWDDGNVTKEATCKEEGVKTYTCTVCKETKTEAIAKLTTHTPGAEATATTPQICTVCGKELKPATGATEPPATEPPATEPPATEPPATEPPATEPPATEPTVTPTQPEGNKNPDDGEFPIMVVIAIVVLGGGGATAGVILWKKKH